MVNLQFSVTGFFQPSTNSVLGPAVRFTASSVEDAKRIAFDMLSELSRKHPTKYPSPLQRRDWEEVFFHHLSIDENPAADLGLLEGSYKINSFVAYSGGPRKSSPIFFTPLNQEAEATAMEILENLYRIGYRSFPNPDFRPDFFNIFVEKI